MSTSAIQSTTLICSRTLPAPVALHRFDKGVAALVLNLLPTQDLAQVARVSRSWAQILERNPFLWRLLARRLKLALPREPGLPDRPAATAVISSFWRGVCEAEARRNLQIKTNIYCMETLKGHTETIYALKVDADGRVYTGSDDRTAKIWTNDRVSAWRCEATLEGHADFVRILQLGADGRVYTGSWDGTAKVWSKGATGVWECEATLDEHTDRITALQLGADGRVYTGSEDCTVKVWSKVAQGVCRCEATLKGHTEPISALQLGRDGKVYTGSLDGTVRVWSKVTEAVWKCEATLQGSLGDILTLQLGRDGKLSTGSYRQANYQEQALIQIWERDAKGVWKSEMVLHDRKKGICAFQLGADGRVYAGFTNGAVTVFDKIEGGFWNWVLITEHDARISSLQIGADGRVYTASMDGTLKISREERPRVWKCEIILNDNDKVRRPPAITSFELRADGSVYTASMSGIANIVNFSVHPEKMLKEIALSFERCDSDEDYNRLGLRMRLLPKELLDPIIALLNKQKPLISDPFEGFRDGYITNQDIAAAIRQVASTFAAWKPRAVALEFARCKPDDQSFAMEKFHALPLELKNRVYGKLYELVRPIVSGPQWGEHSFLHQHGHSSTPAEKAAAILEALASEQTPQSEAIVPDAPMPPQGRMTSRSGGR